MRKIFPAIFTLILLAPLAAFADAADLGSPYRAELGSDSSVLSAELPAESLRELPAAASQLPIDRRLTVRTRTLGNLSVRFDRKRSRDWPAFEILNGREVADVADVTLMQGRVTVRSRNRTPWESARKSVPIAASIFKLRGKNQIEIYFVADGPRARARMYLLSGALNTSGVSKLRVRSLPSTISNRTRCASESEFSANALLDSVAALSSATVNGGGVSAKATRVIEMITYVDSEWSASHPGTANASAASVVNAADAIYRDQLSLSFTIKEQRAVTLSNTAASALLDEFRTTIVNLGLSGSADVHHLYSGKELDGDVIGIAYSGDGSTNGVLCRYPTLSMGITSDQANFSASINPVTTAHEIGHNLAADHDDSDPQTIMTTQLSLPVPSTFSSFSKGQIGAYVTTFGSCLATSGGGSPTATPTPTPTSGGGSNPTPTPTSTRPPSSGGGGTGSGSDPNTGVDEGYGVGLTTTIRKNLFSLRITLNELVPGCSLVIRSATTRNGVASSAPFVTFVPDALSEDFAVTLKVSSNELTKKKAAAKVFFSAEYCGETSASVAVTPSKVRPNGNRIKNVKLKAWIAALKKGLGSAVLS
jgi:hypothetical protein